MPPSKTAKSAMALKAMKKLGYPEKTAKPVLNKLLKLYDNNWTLIKEGSYRVLVEAILDSEEQKARKETQENEPVAKKTKRSSPINQGSPSTNAFGSNSSKVAEFKRRKQDIVYQRKHKNISSPEPSRVKVEQETEYNVISDDENDEPEFGETDEPLSEEVFYEVLPLVTIHPGLLLKESCHTMPPSKTAKSAMALKAMKKLGYPEKTAKPVLNKLLKLYDNNWTLIKEDSYRVLVEAILDSEEQKARNETRENEPVAKKTKRSSEVSPSSNAFGSNSSKVAEFKLRKQDIVYQRKHKNSCSPKPSRVEVEQETEYNVISDDENEQPEFWETDEPLSEEVFYEVLPLVTIHPDPPMLLLQGSSFEDCPNEDCSMYPEVIALDTDDEEENIRTDDNQLLRDALENSCDVEANNSEPTLYENPEAEKDELVSRDSRKLVVAMSSSGEVKITLTCHAPPGFNFRVPTLGAFYKRVEQQYLSKYKFPAGFSLLQLMQDMCECFLAAVTTSKKETDSEIGPSGVNNSQQSLFDRSAVPNDTIFDSCQIPRLFRPMHFGFSHQGPISLNLDLSVYAIVEKQAFCLFVKDIAKGYEAREVSLIKEVDEEIFPKFSYIPKNMTYRHACMSFTSACVTGRDCCFDCSGDCLALENPTCNCSGENGCDFAYTPEGLLKENFLDSLISTSCSLPRQDLSYCPDCPLERSNGGDLSRKCKGHVNRKFIKECWYKCGCGMSCGNRVVQRGLTAKLQVFVTPDGKGWGLRTLEDVPKGAFICEYVGEVVTIQELFERTVQKTNNSQTYPVVLDAGWSSIFRLKDDEALCLDATVYGNVARFINHRCCDANLVYVPVELETPDHHYYHVAFFTTREIKALEELTWDYGVDFGDRNSVTAFQCRCGSKLCRDLGSVRN